MGSDPHFSVRLVDINREGGVAGGLEVSYNALLAGLTPGIFLFSRGKRA